MFATERNFFGCSQVTTVGHSGQPGLLDVSLADTDTIRGASNYSGEIDRAHEQEHGQAQASVDRAYLDFEGCGGGDRWQEPAMSFPYNLESSRHGGWHAKRNC